MGLREDRAKGLLGQTGGSGALFFFSCLFLAGLVSQGWNRKGLGFRVQGFRV